MTGFELLALGTGAMASYEAEQKHEFFSTAIDTLKNPFTDTISFKQVLSVLLLILVVIFIWRTILNGYIWE
jgi:hypothetical protein